jgi:AraC-like DNA-binding protein/tetratricopeptide (TPR) repeat protein
MFITDFRAPFYSTRWIIPIFLAACNSPQPAPPARLNGDASKREPSPLEVRAENWIAQENLDSALYYLELNYAEAQKSRDERRIADALQSILDVKIAKHAYTEAAQLIEQVAAIYERQKRPAEQARVLLQYGIIPLRTTKPEQVQNQLIRAFDLFDSLGLQEEKIRAAIRIGNTFVAIGSKKDALRYYHLGLEVAAQIADTAHYIGLVNNIGLHYRASQPDSALYFYEKALSMTKASSEHALRLRYNIANIYSDRKQYDKAASIFKQILETAEHLNQPLVTAYAHCGLAGVFSNQGDFEAAIQASKNAMRITESMGEKDFIVTLLEQRYDIYKNAKKWEQALVVGEQFRVQKDSVMALEKQLAVHELEIRYQSEKKSLENSLLKTNLENQQRAQRFGKIFILSLITVLIILGLLLNYVYRIYRQRTNAYNVLMQKFREERNTTAESDNSNQAKTEDQQNTGAQLFQDLKDYFEREKPYLDPDLKVEQVAEQLGVAQRQITAGLKTQNIRNFNHFINHYRIGEARKLLENPEYDLLTIETIAEKSGFGSKQSFYNAFELHTGVKPAFYRQSIRMVKSEVSTDTEYREVD